ncbi:MAG: N-acetyltransferase family protein [Pseudomonadota bacterium]
MTQAAQSLLESTLVRDASAVDMYSVREIYAHQVLQGSATFETRPPTVDDLLKRRETALQLGLPYLVAEHEGEIAGYTYAMPFRPRSAYINTIENSVYVSEKTQGQGIGRALLTELIARCEASRWRQMIAVIGDSANSSSIALHAALGFQMVGTFQAVGFKHGRWLDTVLMQRSLGAGSSAPPDCSDTSSSNATKPTGTKTYACMAEL